VPKPDSISERILERTIFASRWVQAPLYLGLIVALIVYVLQFFIELRHIVELVLGVTHLGQDSLAGADPATKLMLGVLGLIDVVMIGNLLIMVIIGGYETFVSRLHLQDHADQPEWLSHVNAGVLKVKLATALVSISSIHLLKTFIEVRTPTIHTSHEGVMWQVIIHGIFVISAILLAWTDRVMLAGVKVSAKAESH
jgi:uncharacterized protein (TIGR00645 family)